MSDLISTRLIYPPHTVREQEKLARITASMEANGWQGRPLLVIPSGEAYAAMTGSHRWAAADALSIDAIPCVVVDAEAFYGAGYDLNDMWDDDARISILNEIGDEDAAQLMAEEIAENNRNAL